MSILRTKLWPRLTLAFVFVALVGVLLVALLANRATSIGFARYLRAGELDALQELRSDLGLFYAGQNSWNGVNELLRQSSAGPQGNGEGYFLRLLDNEGQVVASRGGQNRALTDFDVTLPLIADGQQVGRLLAEPAGGGGRAGEQYLTAVNQALLWSGLVAIIIALLLGLVLARRITQPISRMASATQAIAAGELDRQVPVTSADEVGQLAQDFNQMARALAVSETQRRQLLADTAHDLRTPISIIRSHLEAMLDGVFPTTPENLAAIHEETLHLSRLVDDVRTLSLAETGQLPLEKKLIDLRELISGIVAAFAPLAEGDGVRLVSDLQPVPRVNVDEARIHQALANLISNALLYAVGGNHGPPLVTVTLMEEKDWVLIAVADNGPGLSAVQQQHVFDRFWRSDSARDRQKGGSGLGLAITKSIVDAHEGTVRVRSTPGEGTVFTISLHQNL
ncbi:MAG: ATP-binding protein [Candidatus Promineifilaceae bacterium]|nr:ATP-binding protein [Candidatus Promineifilaceae bacterium]